MRLQQVPAIRGRNAIENLAGIILDEQIALLCAHLLDLLLVWMDDNDLHFLVQERMHLFLQPCREQEPDSHS